MELDCPSCHAHGLKNTLDAVSCRSCKFSIRKVISGRDMADEELKTLLLWIPQDGNSSTDLPVRQAL